MSRKGFSLIEVLVISFIGVTLALLAAGLATRSREFARTMGCVNNLKQITHAVEGYYMDWKDMPDTLASLKPRYIRSDETLHCPADSRPVSVNSYDAFLLNRPIGEEDANKLMMVCSRHYQGSRTVLGLLSYAVDMGATQKVTCMGAPAEFGKMYTAGPLRFADGTEVNFEEPGGEVGVLTSVRDPQGKIYSIIYVPEGKTTKLRVTHSGDSRFEIVTPALIAGVAGTTYICRAWWDPITLTCKTEVFVQEGTVNCQDRAFGRTVNVHAGESLTVEFSAWTNPAGKVVPRKPPKKEPKKFLLLDQYSSS